METNSHTYASKKLLFYASFSLYLFSQLLLLFSLWFFLLLYILEKKLKTEVDLGSEH